MKARMWMLVTILAVGGCAQDQFTPDGRKEIPLDCSGPTQAWAMCTQQAKQTCGASGYDIISKTGEASNVTTEKSLTGQSNATPQVTPRTLVVACRNPPPP